MSKIKFLLIGNPEDINQIGIYPESEKNGKIMEESMQIFTKYCQRTQKSYDIRSKITEKIGIFYFTLNSSNVFYLVLVDPSTSELDVFNLIDDIHEDKIYLLIDNGTKKLNSFGKEKLKSMIDNFDSNSTINKIKIEIEDTGNIAKNNIRNLTSNLDHLQNLEEKSTTLKNNANEFKQKSLYLKKKTWWQNCKWFIIIILIVIILLIIIIPIAVSAGKKNKNKNDDNNKGKHGDNSDHY